MVVTDHLLVCHATGVIYIYKEAFFLEGALRLLTTSRHAITTSHPFLPFAIFDWLVEVSREREDDKGRNYPATYESWERLSIGYRRKGAGVDCEYTKSIPSYQRVEQQRQDGELRVRAALPNNSYFAKICFCVSHFHTRHEIKSWLLDSVTSVSSSSSSKLSTNA